eukprot:NODE_526_length_1845_cov_70.552969_g518_i0.p1 GENE.NODE_526_length_1845_cov_70.552969_g518_i0~~NODE_526_length_1845_cov_70.552969_g518_i0.p1  ORF type:complete len:585 (+),score=82.49 NODE_526_length_1845_cov_70.552969_g518_i0:44-1756(+)
MEVDCESDPGLAPKHVVDYLAVEELSIAVFNALKTRWRTDVHANFVRPNESRAASVYNPDDFVLMEVLQEESHLASLLLLSAIPFEGHVRMSANPIDSGLCPSGPAYSVDYILSPLPASSIARLHRSVACAQCFDNHQHLFKVLSVGTCTVGDLPTGAPSYHGQTAVAVVTPGYTHTLQQEIDRRKRMRRARLEAAGKVLADLDDDELEPLFSQDLILFYLLQLCSALEYLSHCGVSENVVALTPSTVFLSEPSGSSNPWKMQLKIGLFAGYTSSNQLFASPVALASQKAGRLNIEGRSGGLSCVVNAMIGGVDPSCLLTEDHYNKYCTRTLRRMVDEQLEPRAACEAMANILFDRKVPRSKTRARQQRRTGHAAETSTSLDDSQATDTDGQSPARPAALSPPDTVDPESSVDVHFTMGDSNISVTDPIMILATGPPAIKDMDVAPHSTPSSPVPDSLNSGSAAPKTPTESAAAPASLHPPVSHSPSNGTPPAESSPRFSAADSSYSGLTQSTSSTQHSASPTQFTPNGIGSASQLPVGKSAMQPPVSAPAGGEDGDERASLLQSPVTAQ